MHDTYAWKLWIEYHREMIPEVLSFLVPDVKFYIKACETCKAIKAPIYVMRPPLGKSFETTRFFQRLFIDFFGPYPRSRNVNIGIFIILEHISKFVFDDDRVIFIPCKGIKISVIVRCKTSRICPSKTTTQKADELEPETYSVLAGADSSTASK